MVVGWSGGTGHPERQAPKRGTLCRRPYGGLYYPLAFVSHRHVARRPLWATDLTGSRGHVAGPGASVTHRGGRADLRAELQPPRAVLRPGPRPALECLRALPGPVAGVEGTAGVARPVFPSAPLPPSATPYTAFRGRAVPRARRLRDRGR